MSLLLRLLGAPPAEPDFIIQLDAPDQGIELFLDISTFEAAPLEADTPHITWLESDHPETTLDEVGTLDAPIDFIVDLSLDAIDEGTQEYIEAPSLEVPDPDVYIPEPDLDIPLQALDLGEEEEPAAEWGSYEIVDVFIPISIDESIQLILAPLDSFTWPESDWSTDLIQATVVDEAPPIPPVIPILPTRKPGMEVTRRWLGPNQWQIRTR